jgi:ribose transport system permease protein
LVELDESDREERMVLKRRGFDPAAWLLSQVDILLLLLMTVILVGVIGAKNPAWFSLTTFQTAISQNASEAVVAVAMTFSIISGNIDLSPGAMIALTGIIIGLIFEHTHNLFLGICGGFGFAIAIGLVHGFLVGRLRINAIIVTLAAYIWARGMAVGLANATAISINTNFVTFVNTSSLLGVSFPVFVVIASFLLGWYLLNRTKMGRYTFAVGGDVRATERAGISVLRQILLIFGFMGLMIAVATVITVSQAASAQPYAAEGLELDVIIAVIVGGTTLTGGEGSVVKTAVGVLFVSLLNSGLGNLGLRDADVYFIKGIVILAVLSVTAMAQRLTVRFPRGYPGQPATPLSAEGSPQTAAQ